tara:strand:- start:13 stop:225 length:213 start_codon:yes stop_codon:yes gene_type:complete
MNLNNYFKMLEDAEDNLKGTMESSDIIKASWLPVNEDAFTWADKSYVLMQNIITGQHSYYNVTDDIHEVE